MNKKLIISILCLGIIFNSYGQNVVLKGTVQDSSGHVLDGATVKLLRDSVIVRQTRMGASGFLFTRIATGRYIVKTSFTGFKEYQKSILVSGRDSILNIGVITMQQGTDSSLLEVVVKATIPPMIMKQDTVVYNAAAYKLRPNASVEELLKKLPGITVDKDGGVTLNGKKVEKIYVGGKEFMLNDPKIVTQGFNADMIAAVEAFDNNSEDAKFMGIRDMNAGAALNFTLKKQYRNSTFGKLYAGTNQNVDRYTAGANIERMKPDNWTSVAVNSNSINDLFTGLEKNVSAIPAGDNRHSYARINFSGGQKLNGGYNGADDLKEQQTIRDRQTFLVDSSLLTHSVSSSRNYNQSHNLNLRTRIKIDSMSTVEISGSGRYAKTETTSQELSNVISTGSNFMHSISNAISSNTSTGNNFGGITNISFRHRFHKRGQYLVLSLNGNAGGGTRNGSINNTLAYNSGTITTNQISTEHSPSYGVGLSASYTQPISTGKVFDINYAFNYNNRRNDRHAFQYNPATGKYDLPDTLTTNDIRATSVTQRYALGYNVAGKKLRYQLGIAAQDNQSDNLVLKGSQQSFSQHVLNWFPRATLSWQLETNESVQVNYGGQTTAPTIQQLQPLPDLRNPLIVRIGNPDLNPQFDHNANITFNRFQPKLKKGFTASLQLHAVTDKLVQATNNLAGGVQEIRFVNLNGSYDLSVNANNTNSLGEDGRMRIGAAVHYGKDPGFINGLLSTRTMLGLRPSLNINFGFFERLFIDGDAMLDVSNVDYSVGQTAVHQLTQAYSALVRYELPGGWSINSDFHYQRQQSGTGLPVLDNRLLNAAITKRVFKNGSGQLRAGVYDLLGGSQGINQSISDQSIETTQTTVPQRLFLFSFSWNFRKANG